MQGNPDVNPLKIAPSHGGSGPHLMHGSAAGTGSLGGSSVGFGAETIENSSKTYTD